MKLLFIDESGNSNLIKPDKAFPVFALGAVVIDKAKLAGIEDKIRKFKTRFFGSSDVVLHMSEMTKTLNKFTLLKNVHLRKKYYAELNEIFSEIDISFLGSIFDIATPPAHLRDCYTPTLENLIDLIIENIDDSEGLMIIEGGDKGLNKKIELAWENIKYFGTAKNTAKHINRKIVSFELKNKTDNIIGLQLCDLLVSQISRQYLGLETKLSADIIGSKTKKITTYKNGATPASQE